MTSQLSQRGVTLIELIMVIAIIGVISTVASVFIKGPIDAYVDSARRAALTDAVDTGIRRMARDIRKALPNSTRILSPGSPSIQCLEFIPTKTAGRYRAEVDVLSTGDILNFVASDTSFNMLSLNSDLPADQKIEIGDVVAVYNLGVSGADAYVGDNTSTVRSVADDSGRKESTISVDAKLFPFASGSKRFYVIPAAENIVAYVCDGDGKLRRSVRAFDPTAAKCPVSGPILASNVASCHFVHDTSDLQRNEPVQLTITFNDSAESISLYLQVYENSWP